MNKPPSTRAASRAPTTTVLAGEEVQTSEAPGPDVYSDSPTHCLLTLAELDAASPDNPVWVQGFGFQGVQVNTAALEAAGLGPGSAGVAVDANGQPTGQLTGPAVAEAGRSVLAQLDALSIDEQAECLADFVARANSLGLTAWKDPEGNQQPFNPQGACSEFGVDQHGHQPVLELRRRDRRMAVRRAERMIERTNLRSYGWATTFVYGRSKDVLHQLHRVATENPARVERPRPSPQVVLEESDPDDPTVGSEHPPGWPRGLWARGDDGKQRYFAYELIDAD